MYATRAFGLVLAAALLASAGPASGQTPMGTAFTYQGQLTDAGSPANGLYDFEFKLCDDPAAACEVDASTVAYYEDDKQVDDGLFTVEIDFGADVFNGEARWLELGVRPGVSTGAYEILTPRQELTLTPYALFSDSTRGIEVDDVGRVGIGTTPVNHLLEVVDTRPSSTSSALLKLQSQSTHHDGDVRLTFFLRNGASEDVGGSIIAQKTGNNGVGYLIRTHDGVTHVDAMRIQNDGKVGIGRTPTTNKLEVEGAASKSVAGDWLANSDRRIKTDITRVTDALETIDRLRPVRFKYTDDYRGKHPSIEDKHYLNFVAQEYQEVFPDFVKDSGEDGLLQIDTHPASIYAVAAVQELHGIVKEKDAQIMALEKRNGQIEERLAALGRIVGQLARQQEGGVR